MALNYTNITLAQKCLTDMELLRNFCKFLNYKQQYELLKVSSAVKDIVINHIWKADFRELEIRIYSENDFIVTNLIDDNERYMIHDLYVNINWPKYNLLATSAIHLNADDKEIFLNLNKNNIEKLKIVAKEESRAKFVLRQDFKNLRYLHFKFIEITNQHFQHLADNCKNIETLYLFGCFNHDNQHPVIYNDSGLQIIKSMQSLKNLALAQNVYYYCQWPTVENIVGQLKLQQLIIDCSIYDSKDVVHSQLEFHKLKNFKKFKIGHMYPQDEFLYFQRNFLSNFTNLNHLSLIYQNITTDFFNMCQQSCKNLTHLFFYKCHFNNFTALPKLEEVFFQDSSGLTYRNLKTILSEMNLKRFTALQENFCGDVDFESYFISQTLESFEINCFPACTYFQRLFRSNCCVKLTKLSVRMYSEMKFCLKFVPNLQHLCVTLSNINIKDIFELKYLQKIVLTYFLANQLDCIQEVLKHETLRELSIINFLWLSKYRKNPRRWDGQTNLLSLNIPENMLVYNAGFLLDLLNVNLNLSLKCTVSSISIIRTVLLNKKLPKRFKSINICGISIDCASVVNESAESNEILKLFKDEYYFIL